MLESYFPQGVAKGASFIGRDSEVEWLSKNILSGHHTLLLAPRRYGKTSLALNTLSSLDLSYTEINFQLIVSAKAVEKKIIDGIQDLLKKLISTPELITQRIKVFFKRSEKKWHLGIRDFAYVELTPNNPDDIPGNILTAFQLLEHVLIKENKRAVIFFDEVQEIENLPENKQLEGAIREFAQHSKALVFIFSGSNRGMLLHMFDNRSMPLYELCDRIILKRIPDVAYQKYLKNISKKTFGKEISSKVIRTILETTERHPKRVYNLCFYLWRLCTEKKKNVTQKDVLVAWTSFLDVRAKDVSYNLSRKGHAQIKLLALIATGTQTELTSRKTQQQLNLSGAALLKGLQVLEEQDYIEKTTGGYRILDPLIKDVLLKYELANI